MGKILPLLACVLVRCPRSIECMRIVIGNKPDMEEYFAALPPELLEHIARYLDVFSLSNLMSVKGLVSRHPLTNVVRGVLQKRLFTDPAWFATIDAKHIFQNPLKIRRFFEILRLLNPNYDAAYIDFCDNPLSDKYGMRDFITALNIRADHALSYFFDANPNSHDHSNVRKESIAILEDQCARTIWHTFDSPSADRMYDYRMESPATSEMYVVFTKRIRPEHRIQVSAATNWNLIKDLSFSFSRTDVRLRDPFQLVEISIGVGRFKRKWKKFRFFTGTFLTRRMLEAWFDESTPTLSLAHRLSDTPSLEGVGK